MHAAQRLEAYLTTKTTKTTKFAQTGIKTGPENQKSRQGDGVDQVENFDLRVS